MSYQIRCRPARIVHGSSWFYEDFPQLVSSKWRLEQVIIEESGFRRELSDFLGNRALADLKIGWRVL